MSQDVLYTSAHICTVHCQITQPGLFDPWARTWRTSAERHDRLGRQNEQDTSKTVTVKYGLWFSKNWLYTTYYCVLLCHISTHFHTVRYMSNIYPEHTSICYFVEVMTTHHAATVELSRRHQHKQPRRGQKPDRSPKVRSGLNAKRSDQSPLAPAQEAHSSKVGRCEPRSPSEMKYDEMMWKRKTTWA